MTEQSDVITMISIDEENDEKEVEENTRLSDDVTPYLIAYTGRLEELFTSITHCNQWPLESDVRLYYNGIPNIAMKDMRGKKIRPEIGQKLDLIILTPIVSFSEKGRFTGFSVDFDEQPKKFTAIIKKIIRFISKTTMKPLDFSAVHTFVNDIKQFDNWQKYGFFFPIHIVDEK